MKNKTAEEVYVEMLKPAETVTLKVQHRPDDFSMLKDVAGDGFYIRYIPTNTSRRLSTCSSSVKGPVKLSPRRLISVHPALYIYKTTSWKLSHPTNYVPDLLCDCSDANHATNIGYLISTRATAPDAAQCPF